MKKTLLAFAALAGAALLWFAWPVQSVPGTDQTRSRVAEPAGAVAPAETAREVAAPGSEPVRTAVAGAGEEGTTLLVKVRWSDGTPAQDVGVLLWPQGLNERTARTDAQGEARFADLPPGTVPVEVDRNDAGTRVEVRRGETTLIELQVPEGIALRGLVKDEAGNPVAGARIWLSDGPSQSHGSFVTESNVAGRFSVRDAGPRDFVSALAEGYLPGELEEVRPGEVDLTLRGPADAAQGIVLDEAGQPVPNASVMIGWVQMGGGGYIGGRAWLGVPPQYRRTDAEGRFRAGGLLRERPTAVWACAAGYAVCRGEVTGNQVEPVVLRLSRGAVVEGVVQDEAGQPLPAARVRSEQYSYPYAGPYWWSYPSVRVRHDGSYRLEKLLPGTRVLVAEADGYAANKTSLVVAEDTTTRWNPVLRRAASIRGSVVDDDGRPLPGLQVDGYARRHDGHSLRKVATDAEGRFELLGCEAERYTVRVFEAEDWGWFTIAERDDVEAATEVRIQVADVARGAASLTGRLMRTDGSPIAYADLWVWREPFSGGPRRTTDAEGRFIADHLPPAKYRLEARIPGYPQIELGIFEVGPGEQRDLGDLVLADPGTVEVEVFRADGAPAQQSWVFLTHANGESGQSKRLHEGRARSSPLEPGDYTLRAWGEDVPLTVRELTVRSGETTRLRIDLPPCVQRTFVFVKANPEVEVTWYDSDGKVLGDVTVGHWPEGKAVEVVKAFTPGSYRVVAVDGKRGLRGERAFVIAPGDPPEARVEVVLR